MKPSTTMRIFISCAPGLEPFLSSECSSLGINLKQTLSPNSADMAIAAGEEKGGVEFDGSETHLYKCNLHLRTASRIVVRVGEFYAAAFSELRKKASRLEWERYLQPGQPVDVKVTCHKSRLYHSDAVAERVKGAIEDHFHQPVSVNKSDKGFALQLVLVRIVNDLCTISIDSSGELLHRRGYRQAVAKAPLRETLAAGMILAAGWQGDTPLIDPFCGSGTIPIEASLVNRHIAPGINRHFAFMNWAGFQQTVFQELLDKARKDICPSNIAIYASDRDKGAVEMAAANAARTGVKDNIQFACHAISDLSPLPGQGLILTNPPYGIRVSPNKDLRNLYASFGKVLQERFNGWHVGILCSEEPLIGSLALGQAEKSFSFINGGIPVKLSIFSIK